MGVIDYGYAQKTVPQDALERRINELSEKVRANNALIESLLKKGGGKEGKKPAKGRGEDS